VIEQELRLESARERRDSARVAALRATEELADAEAEFVEALLEKMIADLLEVASELPDPASEQEVAA
jgi:hypothetical protein